MKKIIYFLTFILITSNVVFAQNNANLDLNQIMNMATMPTDAEIMKVVNQFGFDQEEKQLLFMETKRKLQSLYNSNDVKALVENMNNISNMQESITNMQNMQNLQNIGNNRYLKNIENIQENTQEIEEATNYQNTRAKKYANHPPLTRKR